MLAPSAPVFSASDAFALLLFSVKTEAFLLEKTNAFASSYIMTQATLIHTGNSNSGVHP